MGAKGPVNYLIVFLLLSPELSISAFPMLDGSALLLILLVTFSKVKLHLIKYAIVLITVFIAVYLAQAFFGLEKVIEAHVRQTEFRINGTWGRIDLGLMAVDWIFIIRNIFKIISAVWIVSWLSNMNREYLLRVLLIGTFVYSVLFYCLIYVGWWPDIVKNVFYQKFARFDGIPIHYRSGWPRLDLGFSESSYLVTLFMALALSFNLRDIRWKNFLIFLAILYYLTRSISVFALFSMYIINTKLFVTFNRLSLTLIIVLMFFFQGPYLTSVVLDLNLNPSFVFRLLGIFDFNSIKWSDLLLGLRMWDIYVQPPLANIILQIGLIGFLFLTLISRRMISTNAWLLLTVFLFVSPQLYNMSFYIFILTLVSNYHTDLKDAKI